MTLATHPKILFGSGTKSDRLFKIGPHNELVGQLVSVVDMAQGGDVKAGSPESRYELSKKRVHKPELQKVSLISLRYQPVVLAPFFFP